MDDSDDEPALTPPAPPRVLKRACVLLAIACRSGIEQDAGDDDAEDFRKDVLTWAQAVAGDELEPAELEALSTPLGELTRQTCIDGSWRSEGFGVLAWALGLCDLKPYHRSFEPPAIAKKLGFMNSDSSARAAPTLKNRSVLEKYREACFALHWRVKQFSLDRQAMNFRKFARECWFGPLEVSGLTFVDDDLAIDGVPIAECDDATWHQCLSLARERQIAANWLAGYDEVYSEVTADT